LARTLDWERAVYDTIMFDNAVRVAKDFAARRNDTLVIVVPDHGHPVSIIGTYDDAAGASLRERLQTYAAAKFPNYPPPDGEGYPPSVEASRRLALVFAAYPDYCDAGRPYLAGENVPTSAGPDGDKQVANEAYCQPGAARKVGNLGAMAKAGVHSADDVVLTAAGPGAEIFHGRVDNTHVFRAIATALGLGQQSANKYAPEACRNVAAARLSGSRPCSSCCCADGSGTRAIRSAVRRLRTPRSRASGAASRPPP
jgi:alkaline phosphatase